MDRRRFLGTVGAGTLLALGGCPVPGDRGAGRTPTPAGTDGATSPRSPSTPGTPPETTTRTPFPGGEIDFPEGPKVAPSFPTSLDRERVAAFVRTYERRYVYNALWIDEHTSVRVSCSVASTTALDPGWRVVVGCHGSAHRGTLPDAAGSETETPITRDYTGRYYTYLIDEETVVRRESTADERPN